MLTFFLIGAALGIITGIPIGPVNIAVIDAAYRHSLTRAMGTAVGGCLGDATFAYLGLVWVGPFIHSHPSIPPFLYIASGIALTVYGVVTLRSRPIDSTGNTDGEGEEGHFISGMILGSVLIALNPSAVVTWVIVVGSFIGGVTAMEGSSAAIGVLVGSFLWFTGVAYLSHKGKKILGPKMLLLTRVVGGLLVVYGVFSVFRGAWVLYKLVN